MSQHPFETILRTASEHFTLCYYAAVVRLIDRVAKTCGARSTALKQFPFLVGYHNELAEHGLGGLPYEDAETWWRDATLAWEQTITEHLPLRSLRNESSLTFDDLTLLMTIGLVEEDARFGSLFEALHSVSGQARPTIGLLDGWWKEREGDDFRLTLRNLEELGLVHVVNPDAPRMQRALQVPGLLWEAMRGATHSDLGFGMRYLPLKELTALDELIVPEEIRSTLLTMPELLGSASLTALILRGPQHNGRRTILGSVAKLLGRGIIQVDKCNEKHDEHCRLLGPLSILMHAMPLLVFDLAPAESVELPRLNGYAGPIGVVMGQQGGLNGSAVERAITLTIEMPEPSTRCLHWESGLGHCPTEDLMEISEQFRMTSGNIRRIARLAQSYAVLRGSPSIGIEHVQYASRSINRQVLDTLATRLSTSGDWANLAVGAETLSELQNLEARCRHRERLPDAVGTAFRSQLNCGVRALFSGPSGTGKTLAARLLASLLHKDIYRLDLSAVVNKYIGETEKNLNEVFARAEELDVMLLLDEGDALLTQRTSVQTSNDRYANLETNFLLQRLESFEGILIVTTNAGERIDGAFQRRMDIVVDFRPPDQMERQAIWSLHLPEAHAVNPQVMQEVISRCTMTGGQIRNAAVFASMLALNNGGIIGTEYLVQAVQREYRKIGAVCPLRSKNL